MFCTIARLADNALQLVDDVKAWRLKRIKAHCEAETRKWLLPKLESRREMFAEPTTIRHIDDSEQQQIAAARLTEEGLIGQLVQALGW